MRTAVAVGIEVGTGPEHIRLGARQQRFAEAGGGRDARRRGREQGRPRRGGVRHAPVPVEPAGQGAIPALQGKGGLDQVIRQRRKITTTQTINHTHKNVMTVGIPLFDDAGELKYAVCFNTVSMEQINTIEKKYRKLQESLQQYSEEIAELRSRATARNQRRWLKSCFAIVFSDRPLFMLKAD